MDFEPRAVEGLMSAIEAFRAEVGDKDSEINEDEGETFDTNRNMGQAVDNAGSSRHNRNIIAQHHGADATATKAFRKTLVDLIY